MSLSVENLKFTIFGHGHDSTRNDSGSGAESRELNLKVYSAVIDSSGNYAWLVTDSGLKKYSTRTWEEVEQNVIPDTCGFVIHPNNVSNNYGIAISVDGNATYIYDMTDDTLVGTASSSFGITIGYKSWDCVLVSGKILMVRKYLGITNLDLTEIDLSNMTLNTTRIGTKLGCCGFVSDSVLYAVYEREWGYQTTTAYGIGLDGSTVWSSGGINNNTDLNYWAIVGNDKLYMPVLIDNVWHYGEFNGLSTPTFSPVTPNRIFGSFDICPNLAPYLGVNDRNHYVAYNDGRTKACALTADGVLVTDFNKFSKVDDLSIPLAMNDRMVICSDYNDNKLYIIGY